MSVEPASATRPQRERGCPGPPDKKSVPFSPPTALAAHRPTATARPVTTAIITITAQEAWCATVSAPRTAPGVTTGSAAIGAPVDRRARTPHHEEEPLLGNRGDAPPRREGHCSSGQCGSRSVPG